MTRAFAFASLVLLGGCPIVDDDGLPGASCERDRDCADGLVCVAIDGDGICIPADGGNNVVVNPPVGCTGKPNGAECSDADACTQGDACVAGACAGTAVVCADGQVCGSGVCIDLGECTLAGDAARVTNTPGVSAAVGLAYDPERDRLALVFDDDVTGLSEIFFQFLDATTGAPVDSAVQITDGRPPTADDFAENSFQPSVVYNPEQDEFGLTWTGFSTDRILGLPSANAFAATVTSTGARAPQHDVVTNVLFSIGTSTIAWTGASYGVAWVDDRNSNADVTHTAVFFAPVNDDGTLASFSNRQISPGDDVDDQIAQAFNPRTSSFAFVYREIGGPLRLTLTNVDGQAPTDFVITAAGNPLQPAIALTSTGFAVAWSDVPDDASLGVIRLALLDDEANPSTPITITDDGELCGRPALVTVPGGLALAYATPIVPADATALEVRLRILDATGAPGPARTLGPGQRPAAAALPTGAAVAWQQIDGEESDVFASTQCLAP